MAAIKVIPPTIKDCGFFLNCKARLSENVGITVVELEIYDKVSTSSQTNSYIDRSIKTTPIARKKM